MGTLQALLPDWVWPTRTKYGYGSLLILLTILHLWTWITPLNAGCFMLVFSSLFPRESALNCRQKEEDSKIDINRMAHRLDALWHVVSCI